MSVFDDIKKDHDRVRKMFDRLMKSSDSAVKTREKTFQTLQDTLLAHMEAEEETLYPAILDTELKQLGLEAQEEHNAAKHILTQLESVAVNEEIWHPRLKVLMETVTHHMDEEEDSILPKAEDVFDEQQIKSISQEFREAKKGAVAA